MRKVTVLTLIGVLVGALLPQPIFPNTAAAATQDKPLTFPGTTAVWDKLYSKQSSITSDSVTVTAPNGSKIKKIEVVQNGSVIQNIVQNASLPNWTGKVTLTGQAEDVISEGNTTAKGYYAWYRYGKGSRPGDQWYYDGYIGMCPNPSGTNELDDFGMPKAPGCTDSDLKLTGNINIPYTLKEKTTVVLPNNVIVDTPGVVIGSAEVDGVTKVDGPRESLDGKTYGRTTYKKTVMESATKFVVYYEQDFNYLGITEDLASYGARVTIYHAAWTVDVSSKTYEYDNNYKLRVTYEGEAPPSYTISGDFDILPSNTINWRDSFTLKPKNFVIPSGCTYQYHEYSIEKDGSTWMSGKVTDQSTNSSYTYASYPYNLGVGSNFINIKVTAACDKIGTVDSGWTAGKYLYINSPEGNQAPQFSAGFFKEYNRTGIHPDYEVVAGSRVNLRIINDTSKDPAWPYDPDGDPIAYTWLFSSSSSEWIRSLPTEYGAGEHDEYFYNLTANKLGYHNVTVIARDNFGAETRRNVSINVIPENPIPIIEGPTEVKENRPLPKPFDGSKSYSPAGRKIIDYIWVNKKDKYTAVGTETIKLDVVDSAGLKSLSPAVATLIVKPDEPPVAQVEVEPLGIRGQAYDFFNKSYSPDGDIIVTVTYRYQYDANNNGFSDDAWSPLPGDLTKARLTPNKVGKYRVEITAIEDYGKTAVAYGVIDVVNQAPAVSFLIEGNNEEPQPPNNNTIPVHQILNNWALYEVNSTTALQKKPHMWTADNGKLLAGLGKGMEQQYSYKLSMYYGNNHSEAYQVFPMFTDNGYGPNSISPYRALAVRDSSRSQPILIPNTYRSGEDYTSLTPAQFSSMIRTNKTHILFDQKVGRSFDDSYYEVPYIFALNKNRIPRYESYIHHQSNGYSYNLDLRHRWLDANPYDFIINLEKGGHIPYYTEYDKSRDPNWWTKAQAGDFSGASYTTQARPNVPKYEITGSRIYAYYSTQSSPSYAYYNCCDSDGWSYTSYGYTSSNYIDIHTYDANTGEFLGSSYASGERILVPAGESMYNLTTLSKGENLLLLFGSTANRYMEFDRSGKLIKSGQMPLQTITFTHAAKYRNYFGQIITGQPATYVCSWSGSYYAQVWKDDKGNLYSYRNNTCYLNGNAVNFDMALNPEVPAGIYLVQFTSDYTLGRVQKLDGMSTYHDDRGFYDFKKETAPVLFVNPVTSEVVTRTYSSVWCNGCWFAQVTEYANVVNINQGTMGTWGRTKLAQFSDRFSPGFYVGHNGAYGNGWRTASASGTFDKFNWHDGIQIRMNANNYVVNTWNTTRLRFGEYVGDGIWLSIYGGATAGSGPGFGYGYTDQSAYMFLDTGTVNSNQVYKGFQLGQFVSPAAYSDVEYTFKMSMDDPTADTELAGLSFRMTDPRNRYAVETNGSKLYLAKYVNGVRSVLDSRNFPFQAKTEYAFKITAQGSRIQVHLNGTPYFDKTDAAFTSGKFGPFSNKSYVSFGEIAQKEIAPPNENWVTNYAIWEEGTASAEVRISNHVFTDPENDPRAGNDQWSIQHTPKFLNNQGLSALHNQTLTLPMLSFDKVGNYRVTLRAQDDPHPNYRFPSSVFAGYRKNSNDYWQIITVHRRPVAQFSLSIHSTNKNVIWDDTSYDPDRWQSPSNYSTENTGINYQTTRGVLERRYYYKTPSGAMVNQKLVTPAEVGTYTVGLQTKDEYGAWSYWNEQQITVAVAVVPNAPPTAGFIVTPATGYRGTTFTITSTASDPEDGPAANLAHEYYIRNMTTGGAETLQSTSRGTWTKIFNSVGVMEIRQVVTDSKGVSAQLVRSVTVLNRMPTANFNWTPQPAWEGDQVTFTNQSSDPDGDSLTYVWRIHDSTGRIVSTGTTTNFQYIFTRSGDYSVTLLASDGQGQASATRSIRIGELLLEPDVSHTSAWLAYHEEKGHETSTPPKQFYSGEQFMLSALVAMAPIDRLIAWIDTVGSDNKPVFVETELTAAAIPDRYQGVLYDPIFSSISGGLPEGLHQIRFRIEYANGVSKEQAVPIEIIGHVQETVNVHRRH